MALPGRLAQPAPSGTTASLPWGGGALVAGVMHQAVPDAGPGSMVPWHLPGTGDPCWVAWCRCVSTLGCRSLSPLAGGRWQNHIPPKGQGSELCHPSICPAASLDLQRPGPSDPTAENQQEGGRLGPKWWPGVGQAWKEELCHPAPVMFVQVETARWQLGVPAWSWVIGRGWCSAQQYSW